MNPPHKSCLCLALFVVTCTKSNVSEDLKAGCCITEFTDAQLWSKIRSPTCSFWPASTEYAGKVFQLLCWRTVNTLNQECLVNIFSREILVPVVGSAPYTGTY